jgi:crotonobetainyl-CoA:carnitine CoA-transferase CaiB-like acyl-CoA transferase
MSAELEKWKGDEILARLLANDVPSAPVRTRFELLEDPQVRASGILEEHDTAQFGRVRQPRPAARFSVTPAAIRAMAPRLGEHNAEVLGDLGYTGPEIDRLEREGVLGRR